MIGNYFEGYKRVAVFLAIMLTVYPAVGFIFAILLRRLFRYFYNRSNKYPYRQRRLTRRCFSAHLPEPPPIVDSVPHSRLTDMAARLSFCR